MHHKLIQQRSLARSLSLCRYSTRSSAPQTHNIAKSTPACTHVLHPYHNMFECGVWLVGYWRERTPWPPTPPAAAAHTRCTHAHVHKHNAHTCLLLLVLIKWQSMENQSCPKIKWKIHSGAQKRAALARDLI